PRSQVEYTRPSANRHPLQQEQGSPPGGRLDLLVATSASTSSPPLRVGRRTPKSASQVASAAAFSAPEVLDRGRRSAASAARWECATLRRRNQRPSATRVRPVGAERLVHPGQGPSLGERRRVGRFWR